MIQFSRSQTVLYHRSSLITILTQTTLVILSNIYPKGLNWSLYMKYQFPRPSSSPLKFVFFLAVTYPNVIDFRCISVYRYMNCLFTSEEASSTMSETGWIKIRIPSLSFFPSFLPSPSLFFSLPSSLPPQSYTTHVYS